MLHLVAPVAGANCADGGVPAFAAGVAGAAAAAGAAAFAAGAAPAAGAAAGGAASGAADSFALASIRAFLVLARVISSSVSSGVPPATRGFIFLYWLSSSIAVSAACPGLTPGKLSVNK